MTTEEFERYYKVWRDPIRRMARKAARGDRDLADDLEQEGLCALAAFDPSTAPENEEAFLRTLLYRRISNARRNEMHASGAEVASDVGEQGGMLRVTSHDTPGTRDRRPCTGIDRPKMGQHQQRRREERILRIAPPQPRGVPRHMNAAPSPDEW